MELTRGNVSWDLEILLAAVGVENVGTPVVGSDQTILVDLEPRASRILGGIVNLGEVDNDWTVVVASNSIVGTISVTWLRVHLNCDGTTGWNSANTRHRRAAVTASHSSVGNTWNWGVVDWSPNTGTGLVNTVHPELLEGRVGRGGSGSGEKAGEERGGLHDVFFLGCGSTAINKDRLMVLVLGVSE